MCLAWYYGIMASIVSIITMMISIIIIIVIIIVISIIIICIVMFSYYYYHYYYYYYSGLRFWKGKRVGGSLGSGQVRYGRGRQGKHKCWKQSLAVQGLRV